jgi:hypothetical protein
MADTSFIPYTTVISSQWAQEVNDHVHNVTAGAGPNAGFHPYLNTQQSWTGGQAGMPFILPSTGTISIDMALGNNFVLNVNDPYGNVYLDTPVNILPGQSGAILMIGTAGGIDFDPDFWKFPGGVSPTLTGTNAWDLMTYVVFEFSTATIAMCNFASNYHTIV